MHQLSEQLGFLISRGYKLFPQRRICHVNSREFETLEILARLSSHGTYSLSSNDAANVRELVRRVEQLDCRSVLSTALDRTELTHVRRIAIWLRGRCGGTAGTSSVARFRNAKQHRVRKEVARALRRMAAWSELREMAEIETCPRIKRMAMANPSEPYENRLKVFSRNVARAKSLIGRTEKRGRGEVFVSSEVDFTKGRPPKSIDLIRAILIRLQKLVRG